MHFSNKVVRNLLECFGLDLKSAPAFTWIWKVIGLWRDYTFQWIQQLMCLVAEIATFIRVYYFSPDNRAVVIN